MPRVLIAHDFNCPLGENGRRGYWEARDAFSNLPPEARQTQKDIEDLAVAESELELAQVCTCGAETAISFWKNNGFAVEVA